MTQQPAPERLIRDGLIHAASQLDPAQYRQVDEVTVRPFVARRLVESSLAAAGAAVRDDHVALIEELAELAEVTERLMKLHGLTADQILEARRLHAIAHGAYRENWLATAPAAPPRRLVSGLDRPLLDTLEQQFRSCRAAHLAVSFTMLSGLRLLRPVMLAALQRGARIRLLTSDYLDVTEPEALEELSTWPGELEVRLYSEPGRSFHVKGYLFDHGPAEGVAVVGSSNLSATALTTGIEWNYLVLPWDPHWPLAELHGEFERLFHAPASVPVDAAVIDAYRSRRQPRPMIEPGRSFPITGADSQLPEGAASLALEPRPAQIEALVQLQQLRDDGERRGLVVAATGIGKTFLAAFDSRTFPRVLFLAHREELLHQARAAFTRVRPEARTGYYMAGSHDHEADLLFASVTTLARSEHLERFAPDHFDYVVVDEFHHAAARSYRAVLHYFQPRFLLGLTATPYRGDNRDIFALCDGNVAYRLSFLEAIGLDWLCPFHYFAVYDETDYSHIPWRNGRYDAENLTVALSREGRVGTILAAFQEHDTKAALGFCVSIEHARFMCDTFTAHGIPALAVHSGPGSADRHDAVTQLRAGQVRVIFTVDMFNEGVDIPELDLVMFLRPTESTTIYLQQLGRGLRKHPDKPFVTVLDFIGNYRKAHFKLPLLTGQLDEEPTPASLQKILAEAADGTLQLTLPPGVELHLDLRALDLMREMAGRREPFRERLLEAYQLVRQDLERRPTLLELHRQCVLEVKQFLREHGTWLDFLASVGERTETEARLPGDVALLLRELERARLEAPACLALLAFVRAGGLNEPLSLDRMAAQMQAIATTLPGTRRALAELNPDNLPEGAAPGTILATLVEAWAQPHGKLPALLARNAAGLIHWCGPRAEDGLALRAAVEERSEFQLARSLEIRYERKNVFNVINQGQTGGIIMLGNDAQAPIPRGAGWVRVEVLGRPMFAKFVKIAINVLKERPDDAKSEPNRLTEVLEQMFGEGGFMPQRGNKVRIAPHPTDADTWLIEPFRGRNAEPPNPPAPELPEILRLPIMSLPAAAGHFRGDRIQEVADHLEVPRQRGLDDTCCLIRIAGSSMEPTLPDGALAAFRPARAGSRQGRIVLVEAWESGTEASSYLVKRYRSTKEATEDGWEHRSIRLESDNPSHPPIVLGPDSERQIFIRAEFVAVVPDR